WEYKVSIRDNWGEVCVGAEKRATRGFIALEERITEGDRRLSMVNCREIRSAANISERCFRCQTRRDRARVFHACVPLVVKELHGEARVNRCLIRIGQRTRDLIEAESGEK